MMTAVQHLLNSTSATGLEITDLDASDGTPVYLGYISAAVAVVFFGSNFIPVKKFETGDGMFFQLVLCIAILFVGIVVNIIREAPKFYPIVMVGGIIWATGNVCVVPIIKTIGMGLGLCIWGCSNLLAGWASGRFGTFGFINPEIPTNSTLNYLGVAMAVFSACIYIFVRPEISRSIEITVDVNNEDEIREPLLSTQSRENSGLPDWSPDGPITQHILNTNAQKEQNFIDKMSPALKRIVGVTLSLISGVLYGIAFAPAIHVQDKVEGASSNALDYVFAHYTGIFTASVIYFVIYASFMRSQPKVYPKVIMPGLLSGLMWGVATSCWFVANKVLSEPVAFPIVTTGPGVVASLWGVFVFKEIRGKRNITLLLLAFCATLSCGILSGFSRA